MSTYSKAYTPEELANAVAIVLEELEDINAHTIFALVDWQLGSGSYDDDKLYAGYKAAQKEIFGTQ